MSLTRPLVGGCLSWSKVSSSKTSSPPGRMSKKPCMMTMTFPGGSRDPKIRNNAAATFEAAQQAGIKQQEVTADTEKWESRAEVFEYTSAANPTLNPISVYVHPPELHEVGPTRVIPFDLSDTLPTPYPATGPNLMSSFVRIDVGDSIDTTASATSQAFYVIRGSGTTKTDEGVIDWSEGDLFVLPASKTGTTVHSAVDGGAFGGAALYWVTDEPLLKYLGVSATEKRFEPTMFRREMMLNSVQDLADEKGAAGEELNRLGVLLGNEACPDTKTLTHVLWSLLNSIGPGIVQRAHRHNSIALDMAVYAKPGVYTMMGQALDENGEIVDPIRVDWVTGGVFVTPPGWWHAHYNESDETAWVLPMQDAGLYTYQRTLDIRFVDDEVANLKNGRIRGAAYEVTNKQYTNISCMLQKQLSDENAN